MANFAAPGFSTGYARGASIRNERDQLRAAKIAQQQERLKASLDQSEKSAIELFDQHVKLIGEAAQNGASIEQIQALAESAVKPLNAHGVVLASLRAQAASAGGTPEQMALLPDPQQFVQDHIGVLNATVQTALMNTPEGKAERAAVEKMAEAEALAQRLGVPVEEVAQAMGITPTPAKPIEAVGAEGPGFYNVTREGASRVPGIAPIPRQGMTIETTPEGGVRVTMGGSEGDLTNKTSSALEASILNSQEGLARLFEIQRTFDPSFLTYAGKWENFRLGFQEKISESSLSSEDRQFLTEYSTFTTNAVDNMNRYIKEITGAQMSESEADRLRKGVPDPERDGPTVFKAKMEANIRQLALARARAVYVRRQGLDKPPWDAVSLAQMDDIFNQRADELTAAFARQEGVSGQEARQKALAQVRQEFGI